MDKDKLIELLKERFEQVKKMIFDHSFNISNPEHKKIWDEMVKYAFELSNIVNPKHHKYMLKNRGVPITDKEFYNHVHPVEDLLKFIDDPHANDDPEDITIDTKYEIEIYSRRWGHTDRCEITRVKNGWIIKKLMIGGKSNKRGEPYLKEILDHDSINYPEELPGYLEWLWDQAKEKGLNHTEVQNSLNNLAEWINLCEKNSPEGIWDGYK